MNPPTFQPSNIPSSKSALIVGAGIAGIQAALDIADAGYHVYLVERSTSIGGRMAQLDKTFPTLDCSACILTPKMAEISRHPNITLLTSAEVTAMEGAPGAFHVDLERQPRYVDVDSCTGCGLCAEVCPVEMPSAFNSGLSQQKAIYRRFPQAIPAAFAIEKRPSPCKSTCPAHIPVQGYVALIAQHKFKEALERVRQSGVPFVGTLGRVCYHPCESDCKRNEWDEPVAICALKRFAYDAGHGEDHPQHIPVQHEERVAIVGAGPAGLTTAYELVRKGYRVTVYDSLPVAGGMLAVGIPEYRLPREMLRHEIDYICALGVELRLNTPVGRDGGPSLDDLRRDYSAVFLAVGAHVSSRLNIRGEDLPGVLHGVTFLRKLNLCRTEQSLQDTFSPQFEGKRVAVIGGGNTAVDAARCALRLGAEVTILYRRSRVEMPAAPWEVAAAEAEGVALNFLVTPVRILEVDGHIDSLECIRLALGEPDQSGRRRPVPIPGSEFSLGVDTVIAAIGQNVDAAGLSMTTTRWGSLAADQQTLATDLPGVFAGGDAVSGPASVVEAVGDGIRAAESIHRYLQGMDLREGRVFDWPEAHTIKIAAQPDEFPRIKPGSRPPAQTRGFPRAQMSELHMAGRITGELRSRFAEVEQGLTAEQAVTEAQRCLECAVCSECLQCVTVCQREAIDHDDQLERLTLDVGALILATGFDVFDPHRRPELGYGIYPEVITTLEFERLVSASGPTAGKIMLNGRSPRKIVFIQCVGSRDRRSGLRPDSDGGLNSGDALSYCSRVCCMAVAKQAHLAHERLPGAEITVFYLDVRAFGKGFEEFYDRVRKEGVTYRRGNPSEIIRKEGKLPGSGQSKGSDGTSDTGWLVVRAEDTLLGEIVEVEADLVVLAVGMVAREGADQTASTFDLHLGKDGYFIEEHPKLRTVESGVPGIFLAGCCQGPKDIPDTVAHAKAAASAAMILLSRNGKQKHTDQKPEPVVIRV